MISRRLSSLPLWTTLQALGRDAISQRVLMAFEACRIIQDIVSKCYGIRILVGYNILILQSKKNIIEKNIKGYYNCFFFKFPF